MKSMTREIVSFRCKMRLIKDYGTAKIKRFTQKQLFKKITKVKTMLGTS